MTRIRDFCHDLDEILSVSDDNSFMNQAGCSGILTLISFCLWGFCTFAWLARRALSRLLFLRPIFLTVAWPVREDTGHVRRGGF